MATSKGGCAGCLVVVVMATAVSLIMRAGDMGSPARSPGVSSETPAASTEQEREPEKPSSVALNASVRFTGTQFIVANNDPFEWWDVKMTINSGIFGGGGYVLRTPLIMAESTYKFGVAEFTKSDGTRFNPWATKPLNFSIWCYAPDVRGFWYGELQ